MGLDQLIGCKFHVILVIAVKNKYSHRSKISEAKFRQLIRCFCLDLNACQTSSLTHHNRNTINRYFESIRNGLHISMN